MNDLISVIIPVYNAEKYICACLESVLNQTYKNIEIICVDDGSVDLSGNICDEYQSKYENIRVTHQKNGGVCAARNSGLEVAQGEYVCFVDSDDIIPEDSIEHLYENLISSCADMSIGAIAVELSNGVWRINGSISENKVSTGNDEVIKNAAASIFSSANSKLYSKKAIGDNRFVVGKKINEDGFFVFQCLMNCQKIIQIKDVTYKYIFHSESASHHVFSEKYYDVLYFRDEKCRLLKKYYPSYVGLANAVYLKHSISFLDRMIKDSKSKHRKEIKLVVKEIRKHSRPLDSFSSRDRIKLFLIKYFLWAYCIIMKH